MTRKKYIKMVVAMNEKIYSTQGIHLDGKKLKWYRDLTLAKTNGFKSYEDAWNALKKLRDLVQM